jgi:NADH:ubiquinone oxidoreductase subunit K
MTTGQSAFVLAVLGLSLVLLGVALLDLVVSRNWLAVVLAIVVLIQSIALIGAYTHDRKDGEL